MQNHSAGASARAMPPAAGRPARLLAVELWGLGDVSLAVPFFREATRHARVTVVAKADWAPLFAHFCPEVEHVPCTAPWTAFRKKYRLHAWPWRNLRTLIGRLRANEFDLGVSARPDPRDHLLLALAGVRRRLGFPHRRWAAALASRSLLTTTLPSSAQSHRRDYWASLAQALGWELAPPKPNARGTSGRQLVIHAGAGQPTRLWPRERYEEIASRLQTGGWKVTLIDDSHRDLNKLIDLLNPADRFMGNDSGPGHLAALLGVPTFTIFGPQLPSFIAPVHPQAAWIEGHPCPYKPCRDYCRFSEPRCIRAISVDEVWPRLQDWLSRE